MNARALLVDPDGRARAPWRIVLFLLLWVACMVVVTIALHPLREPLERAVGLTGTADSVAGVIALLLAHWMTLRTFDQRPTGFVWLHREAAEPQRVGRGFLLGGLPIGLVSLALLGTGLLDLVSAPDGSWLGSAVRIALVLLPAAFYEELLVRGYIFATLIEWLGRFWAILLTSVVFGLLHWWNPGATAGSLASVALAGFYLAVVVLVTQSLYAAWIAHFAWNWVMAAVLHVPVSGLALPQPDYMLVDSGPDWLTGGAWGPEGGAAGAAGMIGGLGYLYWRIRRKTNDSIER